MRSHIRKDEHRPKPTFVDRSDEHRRREILRTVMPGIFAPTRTRQARLTRGEVDLLVGSVAAPCLEASAARIDGDDGLSIFIEDAGRRLVASPNRYVEGKLGRAGVDEGIGFVAGRELA